MSEQITPCIAWNPTGPKKNGIYGLICSHSNKAWDILMGAGGNYTGWEVQQPAPTSLNPLSLEENNPRSYMNLDPSFPVSDEKMQGRRQCFFALRK